jgi:hypothetical protein
MGATGSLEGAMNLATHTTTKTTRRYSRGEGLEACRKIAIARVESRSEPQCGALKYESINQLNFIRFLDAGEGNRTLVFSLSSCQNHQ